MLYIDRYLFDEVSGKKHLFPCGYEKGKRAQEGGEEKLRRRSRYMSLFRASFLLRQR